MPGQQYRFSRFAKPRWDGGRLDGKRMLLHSEQGFGDAIHFSRYISKVADRGAKVSLLCPEALFELFKTLPGVDEVLAAGQPLGDFDVHCPLNSLPLVLGKVEPYFPGVYLRSDPNRAVKFSELNARSGDRFKVGLVWHGQPEPPGRSIPLAEFAPLAMEGVQLLGLQVGAGREQMQQVDFEITDAKHLIEDFADTAAIMQQLDLIISIDTSAAQLAGAMGLNVWVLLKKVPDWRWLLQRRESPWYPSMRLFRQSERGRWDEPIKSVAAELGSLVKMQRR
jgi:hypothetical protein